MTKMHLMPMLCLGLILNLTTVSAYGQKHLFVSETTELSHTEDTGIETERKEKLNAQLSVFPNPALNSVRINSENEINMLAITDKNGAALYSLSLPGIKEVDISNLQGGMYYITAQTDAGIMQSQFIKL